MKNSYTGWTILFLVFLLFTQSLGAQSNPAIELYEEGLQYLDSREYFLAIDNFNRALSINPVYSLPKGGLAEAYYYLDELDVSLRFIDEALALDPSSSDLQNLKARILLAIGNIEAAQEIYGQLLLENPYDLEASLGLAESFIVQGELIQARQRYEDALDFRPQDPRSILALALVSEEQNRIQEAEGFVDLALGRFSDDPFVQGFAAEFFRKRGDLEKAQFHGETALTMVPDNVDYGLTLSQVYLDQGKLAQGLSILEQINPQGNDLHLYWYSRAVIQLALGNQDQALSNFQQALRYKNEDEVTRLFIEKLVKELYDFNSLSRMQYGEYHFSLAQKFLERNRFKRASYHFRRGLGIAPTDIDGRLAYAEYFRSVRQDARFLEEMKFIRDQLGRRDTYITDSIEIYENILLDSLSNVWGVDQFSIDKDRYTLAVFLEEQEVAPFHISSQSLLANYFSELLLLFEQISLDPSGLDLEIPEVQKVDNANQAFQSARNSNMDYYIVLNISEEERDILVEVRLYLSRTGTLLKQFRTYRTGNQRVQNAFFDAAEQISQILPARGTLLARDFDLGMINLGSAEGVTINDVFAIVESSGVILSPDFPGFYFNPEQLLGFLTITKADELISEGTIENLGFFDLINQNDKLFLLPVSLYESLKENPNVDEIAVDYSENFSGLGVPIPSQIRRFPSLYQQIRTFR